MPETDRSFDGEHRLLIDLVDFVLPVLKPYEFALYGLLLRLSHIESGEREVIIGKRSISEALGRGTRSARGGNYQHITEKLAALEAAGFLRIGDTDRRGTRYDVALPAEVPVVRERLADAVQTDEPLDFYNDPELRTQLFERDGWRCRYCGADVDRDTATLDHVVPRSKGGLNGEDNLATCCLMCNSIKSGAHMRRQRQPFSSELPFVGPTDDLGVRRVPPRRGREGGGSARLIPAGSRSGSGHRRRR